jgi:hypothetical protein
VNRSTIVLAAGCLLLPSAGFIAGYCVGLPEFVATLKTLCRLTTDVPHRLPVPDREEELYQLLSRQGWLKFGDEEQSYVLFVKNVRDRRLVNPVLKIKAPQGEVSAVCNSLEGDLRVDPEANIAYLHLKDGRAVSEDGSRTWFQERTLELPLSPGSPTPAPE